MPSNPTIRPATEADLPQIREIFEHYVLNTVVSFLIQRPPLSYITRRYEDTIERNLPYLVAVQSTSGSEKVVGYAYASAFRGFMLGYGHSVEITIFCDPNHVGKGVGSLLMKELLSQLRKTKHVSKEASHDEQPHEFEIKRVMAVMAVDDTAPGNGLALRDWYLKWGFEEVGRLKKIGFKNGREYARNAKELWPR